MIDETKLTGYVRPTVMELQIGRLELRSGDILVVKSQNNACRAYHNTLSSLIPAGVRVLYIPNDVELSVLTKADIEKAA